MAKYFAIFYKDRLIGITQDLRLIFRFITAEINNGNIVYDKYKDLTAYEQSRHFNDDYLKDNNTINAFEIKTQEVYDTPLFNKLSDPITTTIHNYKINVSNAMLQYNFTKGDIFDIYISEKSIFLKKVPICVFCRIRDREKLIEYNKTFICKKCLSQIATLEEQENENGQ